MKKKILAILLVAMMVVSILPVSAFAEAAEEVEATCPGAGKTHTLDNCTGAVEKETVEGNCEAWGYTIYECSVCGDNFAGAFVKPVDSHKISNPTVEAVAPTCTEAGKTAAGVCDVCGKEVESTEVAALSHKKADDDKGTPTKTEDGKCGVAYKCVTCGETYVVVADKDHVWNTIPAILVEPVEHTWGVAEYTCTVCGATKEVPVRPEVDCKLEKVAAVAATCEKAGNEEHYKCSICGYLFADAEGETVVTEADVTIPALGHDFSASKLDYTFSVVVNYVPSFVVYTQVDLKDISRVTKVAFSATTITSLEISLDGSNWVEADAEVVAVNDKDGKQIGVELVVADDYLAIAKYVRGVSKGSPAQAGLSTVEGYAYNASTTSSCTVNGTQVVTCKNGCGETETQTLPLAEHTFTPDPIRAVAPTCTTWGFDVYGCLVCGNHVETKTLEPLGHTAYDDKTSTNQVKKDPTCTKEGSLSWNCGACGAAQTAKLNPTGCSVKTVTVAATCNQYGYTFTYCTNDCDAKDVVKNATTATVTNADKTLTATVDVSVDGKAVNLLTCVVDFEGGLDPENHTRDNTESYYLKAPTCTADGIDVFYCLYCDYYAIQTAPAKGHDFSGKTDDNYTAPTCEEAGYWTVACAKGCKTKDDKGNEIPVTAKIVDEKAPALGHKYADQPTVTKATCIADGYKFYDCERCSNKGTFDLGKDLLVEKLDKLVNTNPVQGFAEAFVSKEAAAAVHTVLGEWTVVEQGNCEKIGLEAATCGTCDTQILAVIAKTGTGHTEPAYGTIIEIDSVDNWYGYMTGDIVAFKTKSAYYNGTSLTEDPNIGMWVKVLVEVTGKNTYKVIAVDEYASDKYAEWDLKANQMVIATFAHKPGVNKYTSKEHVALLSSLKVGDVGVLNGINDLKDQFPAEVADCIAEGNHTAQYYCTVCGEFVESKAVAAVKEHEKVVDVAAKAATCTEAGATDGWHCANCDVKVESEVIAATGHTYTTVDEADAACTQFGYVHVACSVCGYEEVNEYVKALGHNLDKTSNAAKCLEDGTAKCTRCDYTETLKAQGHVMTVGEGEDAVKVYFGFCDQEVPANNKCEVCEAVVKAGVALKHREVKKTEVDATCVEYAYTLHYCTACDWTKMDEDTIKGFAPHTEDAESVVVVEPTFHAAGSKTYTCSVCKGEFTEEIDALEGIGYYVSLDNAVVSGAELVDSATLAVTVSIDGNNADLWGVRFNVKYAVEVLKFAKAEFVTDTYNVLGEANDNSGHVTVVANLSNKDGSAVTLNAESALVVLYFTVDTDKKTVEDSVVAVKSVEAINNKAEAVAVSNEGSAKFDVVPYLDVDEDGDVTLADALIIYNIVSNGSVEYISAADVDKDGVITLFDFIAVYKYLSGEFVYADMVNGGVKVEAPKA